MKAGRRLSMVYGGSFWTGSMDQGLREGFRAAGWIVQDVDLRGYMPTQSRSFGARVAGRLLRDSAIRDYRRELIRCCEQLKPDLFFVVKGYAIDRDTLAAIKRHVGQTALIYPDVDFAHDGVDRRIFNDIDCVLTTKPYHMPFLHSLELKGRIGFVAHGYCTAAHQPAFALDSGVPTAAEIRFIGNYSNHKRDWILALRAAMPDNDLRVIGQRWRTSEGVPAGLVEADVVLNAEYARAIQTAHINVAIHYGKTASGWEDLVSTRTFEIPACGGFMLHVDNEEVREYFTPGSEIDVFSSAEELADKCRFYQLHPRTRQSMIERAYRRCVPAYSYDRRAEQILAFVEQAA